MLSAGGGKADLAIASFLFEAIRRAQLSFIGGHAADEITGSHRRLAGPMVAVPLLQARSWHGLAPTYRSAERKHEWILPC